MHLRRLLRQATGPLLPALALVLPPRLRGPRPLRLLRLQPLLVTATAMATSRQVQLRLRVAQRLCRVLRTACKRL